MPCDLEETAAYQVEKLGYSRSDVRHIVLTHLHSDHSGGLPDFPQAKIHVHALELEAALHPRGLKERFYEPAHWAHQPDWVIYDDQNPMDWFGFPSIRVQEGLSPEV